MKNDILLVVCAIVFVLLWLAAFPPKNNREVCFKGNNAYASDAAMRRCVKNVDTYLGR